MKDNMETDIIKEENNWIKIVVSISLIIVLSIVVFEFIFIKIQVTGITEGDSVKGQFYDKHYVLIVDEVEDPFWQSVYAAAKEEGARENIYVECMGQGLAEDYTVNECLEVAIASKVDGILVAPEDEASEVLLKEAMKQGISVVTLLNDSTNGFRNSFVGINSSNLGGVYGQEINRLLEEYSLGEKEVRIMILMDTNMTSTNQNMIYLGITEALEKKKVKIETKVIDSAYRFGAEENIRNIVLRNNEKPDIVVCLSAVDTLCAYQALVDYNKVGEINLIGYYECKEILEGINKQIIYSTVSVDSLEMGRKGIQALEAYEKNGSVNGYFTVDTRVIDRDNVLNYLME